MAVEKAAGEDIGMRTKRLRYRAWHRGTREMDLILGGYADAHAPGWDAADLGRFEALMEEGDVDLLAWIVGQVSVPADADGEMIADIRRFQLERAGR
jgi:antitoxin CptB